MLRHDGSAVRLFNPETKLGVGPLDFFDSVPAVTSEGLSLEMVEKWWSLGDKENRVGMWIQGIKLGEE
jgi:guanine deaminase